MPDCEAALPDRHDLELRLRELQAQAVELDNQIAADERPPGPLKSPLRSKRDQVRARLADLQRLLR